MKTRIRNRLMALALLVTVLVGTLGTGMASAASGSEEVGGGQWSWQTVPGLYASSAYYHRTKGRSASAQVGTGNVKVGTARAGETARATAYGVGTARVWWDVD